MFNLVAPGDPNMFIKNNDTSKSPFIHSSAIQEMFIEHLLCDRPMLGSAEDTLMRKTAPALLGVRWGTDLSTNSNDWDGGAQRAVGPKGVPDQQGSQGWLPGGEDI